MRPSELEAIRPHLQEAIDDIDAYLDRQRELEIAAESWTALPEDKRPKAKLRTLTEEEQEEALRSFRFTPLIEHAYPWRHSVEHAAVWLRKGGWTTEADAIGEVLSGLPTGPVNDRHPEIMDRQFDVIRAGAERVKTILTACLQEGSEAAPTPPRGKMGEGEGNGGADSPPEGKNVAISSASASQHLRDIAAAIRAMPEVGKNDLPGPFCDDCGGLFWESIKQGAFAGSEFVTLRLLVQRQRNEVDRKPHYLWKRGVWHRVVECLVPGQGGGSFEQWRNACGPVADVIDAEAAKLETASKAKEGNGKEGEKTGRGRKKASYTTMQREATIAANWTQARDAGTYKGDFACDNGMKVADLDRLLDRVAARKKPSD